jgi:outer membrane protein assembly factor BamB
VFCGGDGWIYSFHAEKWQGSRPTLLWKFDTNAKDAVTMLGGRGTRSEPLAPPVLFDDKVFVTIGQDPEHGEGHGRVWCIDATKKLDGSDVSPQLVVNAQGKPVPPRREKNIQLWEEQKVWAKNLAPELDKEIATAAHYQYFLGGHAGGEMAIKTLTPGFAWELQCRIEGKEEKRYVWKRHQVDKFGELEEAYVLARPTGERIVENPDSAVVWKYERFDRDGDAKFDFEEEMHRSISSPVIHGDLVFCVDFSGLVHCLDRRTGKPHWTCDLLAACWSTPLIADGRLFVADEDGDVAIFNVSADPDKAGVKAEVEAKGRIGHLPANEINMSNSIYGNPVAANGVLYIANKTHLFALQTPPPKP